jgi:ATP-dependent Clp protease, protease subunit
VKLSHMMDEESWFNAKKAVELGFADKILFAKEKEEEEEEDEPTQDPDAPEEEEEDEEKDKKKKEGKKKFPFEEDSMMYSRRAMDESFLSVVSGKMPKDMIPINQLDKRLNLLQH